MVYAVIILGCLVVVATVFCVFFYNSNQIGTKIFFGILAFILILVIVLPSITYRDSLNLFKILLKISSKILRHRLIMLIYIPIFLVILLAFMVIIVL